MVKLKVLKCSGRGGGSDFSEIELMGLRKVMDVTAFHGG